MPEHKVSMTSLHWQTSLQTQKVHALTQLHKWLVNELGSLCMDDWVCFTSESAYINLPVVSLSQHGLIK